MSYIAATVTGWKGSFAWRSVPTNADGVIENAGILDQATNLHADAGVRVSMCVMVIVGARKCVESLIEK